MLAALISSRSKSPQKAGRTQKVDVPHAVMNELMGRGESDPVVVQMRSTPGIDAMSLESMPGSVLAWGLGAGESAVIGLALHLRNSEAILDDKLGRRCAVAPGLPVRGTRGLVLLARRSLIPKARPVLEDLLRGGMFLDRRILDEALRRVQE